jgi:hypothetical protein
MEALLDQADALILTADPDDGPERPCFELPESLLPWTTPNQEVMELRENPNKGKGWYAKQSIPVGSVILVAKPIAMALDLEYVGPDQEDDEKEVRNDIDGDKEAMEESENQEEQGSTVNELLVLEVLQSIFADPSIWTQQISLLYPRDAVDIEASPVWISKDDDIFAQFETMIKQIDTVPELMGKAKEISQRLPLIIRYNVLSIETCPELLSHPGPNGHAPLSGVGLYHWPSFFNHDARPNVSRYAVGDIMWFVANQNIVMGQELCISYLEHDVLCESPYRRNLMLTLDFKEDEDANRVMMGGIVPNTDVNGDGPEAPVVDSDVQNELMGMNPFERLEAIDQLMQQAAGEALPEGERENDLDDGDDMDAHGEAWFQCDLQNLRILKAITLEAMGSSTKALPIWEECVAFTETQMPPNDETSIVMRVQAALCSLSLKLEAIAREHASIALQRHHLMFGGGVRRFRRRFRQEFRLNLRPASTDIKGQSMEEFLWPYNNNDSE